VCFITPAFLITLALAILYGMYGTLPQIEAVLWGIQPVMLAIILIAAYRLTPTALNTPALLAIALGSFLLLAFTDVLDVIVFVGAGLLYAVYTTRQMIAAALLPLVMQAAQTTAALPTLVKPTLAEVGAYFLYLGSVLFGSGYVLVSYLQADVVERFGWLTERQLLDAIAIGQFTPGPVLTTAAVVGYLTTGIPGAIIATIMIFLPAFVLVILTAPLIPKMRNSRFFSAFLNGVNAAVIAGIVWAVVTLANAALVLPAGGSPLSLAGLDGVALALGLVTMIALARFKVNATWLVLLGAIVGFVYWMLV